ncbi:hypothetical protein WK95_17885 [Burkholderia ubonensis]|nr:hypothetical protein WK95_17885 [Burkholderia ubonensis]
MQTTLIDGLVNFKEGFSTKLTVVRRSARRGAGARGGGGTVRWAAVWECRERLQKREGRAVPAQQFLALFHREAKA